MGAYKKQAYLQINHYDKQIKMHSYMFALILSTLD